jgi:hypothetical protein
MTIWLIRQHFWQIPRWPDRGLDLADSAMKLANSAVPGTTVTRGFTAEMHGWQIPQYIWQIRP